MGRIKAALPSSPKCTFTAVKSRWSTTLAKPVADIQIYQVNVASITLNWAEFPASPREDSAAGYRLEASTMSDFSSGDIKSSQTLNVALSTLTVTDLLINATYYFRVSSLNGDLVANTVDVEDSTSTLYSPPEPGAPVFVIVSEATLLGR